MLEYLLRMMLLLPLVGGLAFGSLWLMKRFQLGIPGSATQTRSVQIIEILPVGAGSKLAVVEFGGKQHLLSVNRNGVVPIASDDRGDFDAN